MEMAAGEKALSSWQQLAGESKLPPRQLLEPVQDG